MHLNWKIKNTDNITDKPIVVYRRNFMSRIELGNQGDKRQLLLILGQIIAFHKNQIAERLFDLLANDVTSRSSHHD
jgi:hypothetical protein